MSNNAQITPQKLLTSAFGELVTVDKEPVIQITAHNGITDSVLALATGGSISTENNMFKLDSGTGAGTITALLSDNQIQDRPAQGIRCELSFLFGTGAVGNTQQAGLITSESSFVFAVKGTEFGVMYSSGGSLEIQELQITVAAGNETASITIDGTLFSVPLTNDGINTNAYQIATYLDDNDFRYRYTSNGDTVTMIAQLPSFGDGIFSFTSAAAAGVFTEIEVGTLPTDYFTPKTDWNVKPGFDIDHTKGNVGMVQFAYTGFDAITFSLKNSENGEYEVVHIIKYGNSNLIPICSNPVFRIGWVTSNDISTASSVTIKGASAGAFNEGVIKNLLQSKGTCAEKEISSGASNNNVLTIRNRREFNNEPNRAYILALSAHISTEAAKITTFNVIKNPVVASGELLEFSYNDEVNSLLELAVNDVEITGGEIIACYPIRTEYDINLREILDRIPPGETVSITARFSSGQASDVSASLAYKDDF